MKRAVMSRLMPALFAGAALLAAPAEHGLAQDLTIGSKLELTSLDPHFFASFPAQSSHTYLYNRVVGLDNDLNLVPELAERWEPTDDGNWRFFLRKGVKFHDGTDFDADDLVATIKRIPWVPNTTNSLVKYVRAITDVVVEDSHTVLVKTDKPSPGLPRDFSHVVVVPAEAVEQSTESFNDGNVVGTGPYRLVEWRRGESLILERFEDYWGEKPHWQTVDERVLGNDGARVAALLSGDVDAINYTPVEDLKRLQSSPDFNVMSGALARVHYVHMDSNREPTPHVQAEGDDNPLKDARVRKALSLAINREAIIDRLLLGLGEPAGQMLPKSFAGSSANVDVDPYDPEQAKQLLAEAGYPDGFKLLFHATNERYPADVEIAQAVAQMWARIGLDVDVEALARTIFFPKASDYEFSVYTAQYGADANLDMMMSMLHSWDPDQGLGNGNRARYSNSEVDRLIGLAAAELDATKRQQHLQKVSETAMGEHAVIPLYYPAFVVTTRKGLEAEIQANGRFTAMHVHPKP